MDLLVEAAVKDKISVELKKPGTDETIMNDDGTPMTVMLYGPYSKTYRRISFENQNKHLSRFRKGAESELSVEELDEMMFNLIVKCVADWDITAGGEKPECTETKVRELLEALPPIRDQLQLAINDTKAFLGNSETT